MSLGPWEIAAIVLVIVLLFGARKLPDLARSVGRSMRIFKSEVKELNNDEQQPQNQQGQIANAQQQEQDFWEQPQNQPRQAPPVNSPQQPNQHPQNS
ncbi:Sec-independent protein translocase subunit TatA [Corynebacterium halotolerans]|uniref:Sec-independent protein translocase protein TatA n=1 Tax=Corynebacterium halotolerans YIM 70093 = DSM 44683 TaxID=1121362 RepID=M1P757_9CORY|nr:Sec-independent protein translocase subunit TatA [Corynebacterium halotolerans]AGF72466.1 Sec-independent protein translocase [Corynebacterium halotolerans YIM 70093 = DSM 44683]